MDRQSADFALDSSNASDHDFVIILGAFAEDPMARIFSISLVFLMVTSRAFGGGAVDPGSTPCKDYENVSHQYLVDIVTMFHRALKADPKFGSLS